MTNESLTQQRLKEVAVCKGGKLFRRISIPGFSKGSLIGTVGAKGYLVAIIDGKTYKQHRLVWLYFNGSLPDGQIDHINQNKTDNRISNLRVVTNLENCRNKGKSKANTSGVTGVYLDKRTNRWRAIICIEGKNKNLGFYASKKEAAIARKEAEAKYGFHENHGA